jgi:anti-sigma factor RsiW
MNGLTHNQAKRLAHVAADRRLTPKDRAALEAHLAECPACRSETAELNWLHAAITRALRRRWLAPHRPPMEMAARVRNRLRLNTGRKIVAGLAQAVVRLGALAMVLGLVVGLVGQPGPGRGQWRAADSLPSADVALAASNRYNPLSFELEANGEGSTYVVNSAGEAEPWPIPTSRPNDSRDTLY